ncbi:MAG: sigma-70 family RNA polymerase sigma factor, partial [Clostridia bacterium]|nr:sigma-70 family RNA polymerase sigma factor [Clostridia bacterium]
LHTAIGGLAPQERQLIALRYGRGLTQQKTADILGLSQVKISRMEKKILAQLRQKLM